MQLEINMNTLNRSRVTYSTMLLVFSLLIAVVFMASCSGTGQYGRLVPNDKVKNTFETYQLPPDYTYYYSGPDAYPKALIGIQNEYRLESKFWQPVDLTQTQLKRWLEMGGRPRPGYNLDRNGSDILAPDGRQVGIWYAVKNWKDRATVKMIDDKTVNISPPLENQNYLKTRIPRD
jgi:hypothetical protein